MYVLPSYYRANIVTALELVKVYSEASASPQVQVISNNLNKLLELFLYHMRIDKKKEKSIIANHLDWIDQWILTAQKKEAYLKAAEIRAALWNLQRNLKFLENSEKKEVKWCL